MDEKSHMRRYEYHSRQLHYLASVSSAKARVDNGLPKSLMLSQKRRDTLARARSKSARINRINKESQHGANKVREAPELYDDFLPPRSSTQNRNPLRSSYDPLDYHDHYFTAPHKPFTPRINSYVAGTSSALRHYKEAYDYEPPSVDSSTKKSSRVQKMPTRLENGMKTPDFVPRLNIESSGEPATSKQLMGRNTDFSPREWREKMERTKREKEAKQRLINQSNSIIDEVRHSHDAEISKQDEEMAYLEFVRQVTADVIRRNISSNMVIKQVLEWHVEQNKQVLDEARMRDHLTVVSRQLGLMD